MADAMMHLRETEARKMKEGYFTVYISPTSLIMAKEYQPGTIQVTTWRVAPDFKSFTVFLPASALTRLALMFG